MLAHVEEIMYTIQSMKRGKAPGDGNIIIEMVYEASATVLPKLKIPLYLHLDQGKIPENWNKAPIIILFKRKDASLLENYRSISLLCL